MKNHPALIAFLLWAPSAAWADPAFIGNIDGRRTFSLDGAWRTIVDPYETGYYDYRYQPKRDGFFLDQKPRDESDRIEYDFDTSPTLNVPGDWNTQRESLLYYEGTVWYRRTFDDPRASATRLFLHFGAVNYDAKVWLNGEKLGEHEGGFTPFAFELTGKVKPKGNVVIVKADNRRRADAVPTLDTDWWNYGGLTRHVLLVEEPETFVADYFLQLDKHAAGHVKGWVQLDGPKRAAVPVTIAIGEAKASRTVTTDADGRADVDFPATLDAWSPEHPKLYDVELATTSDRVHEAIGFRTIEVRGTDIVLNGRPIFLRGVCAHEEAPFRSGRAYSTEDARTLLGWVKELGGNFIRLAHYPHSESMTREADRMGVLVWSEVPVYWAIHWDDPAVLANARRQLSENISRDKNRASIILWSVGNETPISEPRTAFLGALADRVREMDPTRLVTAALERHYVDENTQMIDDPIGAKLDVIGANEYVGWYDGLPDKIDRVQWKTAYDKPLVMSEWGGDARAGTHGGPLTRWSEEYQEDLYRRQVAMLKRIPFLRGTTPWILMDFRSPHRVLPGVQDGWNRKGLVSDRGERKKAFYVLRDWYREIEAASRVK